MHTTIPHVEHAARVLFRAALTIASLVTSMSVSRAAEVTQPDVKQALTEFTSAWDDKLWEPDSGKLSRYLRPAADVGWKKRMLALQSVARQGSVASGELRKLLQDGSVVERLFAAQALGYCGDSGAQADLARAAEHDAEPAVRLHAADSLGMLGGQAHNELLQRLEKSEKNNDVRRHIRYALERNGQVIDPTIVKQLKDWPTSQLDTAMLGKLAPDFELPSLSGEKVRLSDFRGKKSVVLVFVYGDTWPVCHGQLAQLRDKVGEFEKAGAQLLVVDPHESWSAKHFLKDVGLESGDIGYPLLTDPALTVSATYGVAMQMKIHVELSNRPTTFIIDRDGVIRYERRAKTFSDRPKPDELIGELKKMSGQ